MTSFLRTAAAGLAALALTLSLPRNAQAAPPAPELLNKLAAESATLEAMDLRAGYAIDVRIEKLDGDGKPTSVKDTQGRVEADGKTSRLAIAHCVLDGVDTTAAEQKKQRELEASGNKDKTDIANPFLVAQQPRYVFDQVETDRTDPNRVRITFAPRETAADTIEGSVWVDARTGRPYSTGFKMNKPGSFVDFVHVTIEFGANTPLGAAASRMVVEGEGGFLFFKKRLRAVVTMSDYKIAP